MISNQGVFEEFEYIWTVKSFKLELQAIQIFKLLFKFELMPIDIYPRQSPSRNPGQLAFRLFLLFFAQTGYLAGPG